MARRGRGQGALGYELWAQWCASGGTASAGRSMLAKLIDNKGELFFGGAGDSSEPADSLEAQIEAAVVVMAIASPLCADVLRLEYDAGWWGVVTRRGIKDYDPRGVGQFEKADALGISFATYKRRLSEARAIIENQLGAQ
ncbi:hypothetical protein ACIQU2_27485 [Pseudomonas sp. NPDC098740]|uniref:hypothetical protein n=1 Tax=Pseudomonas sp. NPDC098740 TaxID=3364486 RepID=UPI00383ABA1A